MNAFAEQSLICRPRSLGPSSRPITTDSAAVPTNGINWLAASHRPPLKALRRAGVEASGTAPHPAESVRPDQHCREPLEALVSIMVMAHEPGAVLTLGRRVN